MLIKMNKPGRLFIISSPSGGGKSTLCSALLKEIPGLGYSISYTTRLPRPEEQDGADYHFITQAAFQNKIEKNEWAEWAEVHGNKYGTDSMKIDEMLKSGQDVLFDIDVQGARTLKEKYPTAILIFIAPPSLEALRKRLERRGTESAEAIEQRLNRAKLEIDASSFYDFIITNDDFDKAMIELKQVIRE
ncbi:MAG: guanylate kinase [Pseudomonadota bacterium]